MCDKKKKEVDEDIYIASFDIGKVNFAYCIEKCSLKDIKRRTETTIDEMCSKGKIEIIDNVRLVSFQKILLQEEEVPEKEQLINHQENILLKVFYCF